MFGFGKRTCKKELESLKKQMQELMSEIRLLTEATIAGKLDARGDPGKFQGKFAQIVQGVNDTLDAVISPLNVAAEYVDRISKGDIPDKITDEYKGDFNEIKNNLNQCIDAVNGLVAEATMLTEVAVEGKLEIRGDVSKFSGEYANIVKGINSTIETLVGHIDQIPAPCMIIDRDFTIRYINKAGADTIGMTQQRLIGEKCYDHFKTSDCQTEQCACARAMSSGESETSETDAHPGGKDLAIAYNGVPMRNQSGEIIGTLEIVIDQTETRKAMEDARTKVDYLNRIPTPVVVVDKEFTVRFINPTGASALGKTPEACLGQKCFNLFNTPHCNTPDCQVAKAMQQDGVFTNDTTAALPSGKLPIRYTGAPLKDSNGNIVGALEYVLDISKEMEITTGLVDLAEAAVEGKWDSRADIEKFEGNYRRIVQGVNDILDAVIAPLNVAAEYVERISKGEIPEKITDEYKGDFNEIKNNLNQCIDAVSGLVAEADRLTKAAVAGKLDVRGDVNTFHGDFAKVVQGVNNTLDAVIGPLNVAAEYVERISKGNIPEPITDEYRGDFNEIKNNLNQCIDAINGLVAEATMLTKTAVEGKLDTRGDVQKFNGAYANIVKGINSTIETLVGHIDQIPAPCMIIDKEFNIRYVNKAGADVLGMTQDHLIGQKCYDHFKTSDCHTTQCACARAMSSGESETSETEAHPGGKDLLIAYNAVPIRDQSGEIIGALEIVIDQTETRKAMDDARTKVDYLNKIPTPVVVVDKNFNIQFVNPAGASTLGKTPETCLGQKCFNLFNTPHCNTPNCQLAKAMQQDGIFTSDTVATLPSGELPIRYTGAPLKDDNGDIVGGLEYVLDISKEVEITNGLLDLSAAALEGKLDTRADVEKFGGNYRRIVQGVNDILDAVIAPLNVAAEYVERISKGDIPEKIIDEYRGDFNEIKNNLNMLIDAMNEITRLAEEMAEGDLTVEVNERSTQDRLMQALNEMIKQLNGVVMNVKASADNVASGSQAMSSSSEEMSQGATEQAAAAEQASSSMEQMAANIRQNADNALQTEKIAVKVADDARESGRAVAEAVDAMREIAKKIMIIEDITRQTRMLSLNATIEAARAQEHGRGFGVVASEVRALAERSQAAATEINQLASSSVAIAEKAGEMLKKLVPDIQKTAELVQEISAASKEQDSGAEQINNAIQQLDNVIQQNSATSEEMASMAEELASQAEMLQNTVAFFNANGTGQKMVSDVKRGAGEFPLQHLAKATPMGIVKKNRKETGIEQESGDGKKPGGFSFQVRPNEVQGDERDAEFEKF